MILVLAGTADGRNLAKQIQAEGYEVLVSTATEYGGELAQDTPVRSGALDKAGFTRLFAEKSIDLVVDASHPFAINLSRTVMDVCEKTGKAYIRFERPATPVPENPLVHRAYSFHDGAKKACELGECIFLAIGSNNLEAFTVADVRGKRLIARVLPVPAVVKKCLDLGFRPGDIVAMQGPFGPELNRVMLKHYGAQVLVTKESGEQGGTDSKIQVAIELGIPVVLIVRPELSYPVIVEDWESLRNCIASHAARRHGGLP
mgnify:CR=1 FL=1